MMSLRLFESIKFKCKISILLVFCFSVKPLVAEQRDGLDVVSYKLSIDITAIKSQQIRGEAILVCKPELPAQPQSIKLMLLKLKVDSVLIQNTNLQFEPANFTYNDTFLDIKTILNSEKTIKIFYHGSPIKDAQWGGFYFSGNYAFNMGVGFASNPHNYGRVWFPCHDNFYDKSLFEYFIKVPQNYTAVCGGEFIDTSRSDQNSLIWHWKHTIPISTYLASMAVAPYQLLHGTYNGAKRKIPFILAAEAKDTANLIKSFMHLNQAMEVFENVYGPYVFERIGYCLVPFNSGAMEHACNIAYPIYSVDGTVNYETLMAHELSHHWWGNNITCLTAGDMWLNEGWASYSEALFIEKVYGKSAYIDHLNKLHKYVLQFAHLRDEGATGVNNVSHENTYGDHVYKKGADMVHCIRSAMGDADFNKACNTFIEKFKLGNVTNADFISHFNANSGIPSDLISQLISDTGFFHFSIYNSYTKKSNQWETDVYYKQRKRFGNHVYNNMPMEVSAFDKNFKREIFKVNFGTSGTFKIITKNKAEFICIDYDQKMSDAITDDVILTDSIGVFNNINSMMPVTITAHSETSLIRIEHNWVYPDAYFLNIPNVLISKERYWTVDGIFDASLKASATVNYDGSKPSNYSSGWLDNQLLEGRAEDSLVLLYRKDAESYWQIETKAIKTMGVKLDKKGSFTIPELKKGQYAFGVYGKSKTTGFNQKLENKDFKWYPNPAGDKLYVEWANGEQPENFNIFNSAGQLVMSDSILASAKKAEISTQDLASGTYYLSIYSSNAKLISSEFIIAR